MMQIGHSARNVHGLLGQQHGSWSLLYCQILSWCKLQQTMYSGPEQSLTPPPYSYIPSIVPFASNISCDSVTEVQHSVDLQ